MTRPGPRCVTHQRAKRKGSRDARWATYIFRTYGITEVEYWALYEAQGGRCYGCQRATGKTKKLSVDHDHKTGKVRGLLCTLCNRDVLGHLREDVDALRRLADYIENPPAFRVIGERVVPGGPG